MKLLSPTAMASRPYPPLWTFQLQIWRLKFFLEHQYHNTPIGISLSELLNDPFICASPSSNVDTVYANIHALTAIGMLRFRVFTINQNDDDLEESLAYMLGAVIDEPLEIGNASRWWLAYVAFLNRVFRHTRDQQYLQQAYELTDKFLACTPTHCPEHLEAETFLSILASERFKITQNIEWLERGVNSVTIATGLSAVDIESILVQAEVDLEIFGRTEETSHIKAAIELAREAVRLSTPEHLDRSRYHLACTLARHYEVLQVRETIEAVENLAEAIDLLQHALESMPRGSKYRFEFSNAMGTMLMLKYKRSKVLADLLDAMLQQGDTADFWAKFIEMVAYMESPDEVQRELCSVFPDNNPEAHMFWKVCRSAYFPDDAVPDAKQDINRAIDYLKDSLAISQESLEGRAGNLLNLAQSLKEKHNDFGDLESKSEAIDAAMKALWLSGAPPTIRIQAGLIAAGYAEGDGNWTLAARLHTKIIALIPSIVSRSSSRRDYQHMLRMTYGTSTRAAAAVLQSGGTPSQVLDLLEGGRGLIASQLVIGCRDDVSDLARLHPELSGRYEELRALVLQPPGLQGSLQDDFQRDKLRAALASREQSERALSLLEAKIRSLPEFSRFQLGMRAEDLVGETKGCHIVYFNIARLRSDAICIDESGIRVIPLPDLEFAEMKRWARYLVGKEKKTKVADLTDFMERNESISQLLVWLWNAAVKPVLKGLDLLCLQQQEVERMPHIIWIPTTDLSFFPIHAAGSHNNGSKENTLSHVVSSYAVTIRSLVYANKNARAGLAGLETSRVLAVAMRDTPDHRGVRYSRLNVDREVDKLKQVFINTRTLKSPSRAQVLDELQRADLIHFACHGVSNAKDPSSGALLLYDAATNAVSPLTIDDIASVNHRSAHIAYLSACSTADSAATDIADESIHLASAFQLAGFPHVIGTLWEADDDAATAVAKEFYSQIESLLAAGTAPQNAVACALHQAVVECRKGGSDCPIDWAPFVHFGR